MSGVDKRKVVGEKIHAKAMHAMNLSECSRRYGSRAKTSSGRSVYSAVSSDIGSDVGSRIGGTALALVQEGVQVPNEGVQGVLAAMVAVPSEPSRRHDGGSDESFDIGSGMISMFVLLWFPGCSRT
jgi:hypothetical protein